MPKAETILEPTEEGDYKSPHLDNLNRRYLGNNNKDREMPDVKHIIPISNHSISERTTSIWSKLGIQFTQGEFKSIKFDDG